MSGDKYEKFNLKRARANLELNKNSTDLNKIKPVNISSNPSTREVEEIKYKAEAQNNPDQEQALIARATAKELLWNRNNPALSSSSEQKENKKTSRLKYALEMASKAYNLPGKLGIKPVRLIKKIFNKQNSNSR